MKRRAVLAGVPTALLMGGCTDLLSGESVRFEAETAIVSESARSDTGYQEKRVEEQKITRNFSQIDKKVVVVNSIAEYSRSISLGPLSGELARFTVLASPAVTVGPVGPLNPLDDMSNKELAQTMQQEYSGISSIQKVSSREQSLLGNTVTVTKFSAKAETQGGQTVDIYLHIAKTESADDFIAVVGAHPQDIDEEGRVNRLMEGVVHPANTGTATPS